MNSPSSGEQQTGTPGAPPAVRALLVLAIGYTLYAAQAVLLPMTIAVLLALLLRPPVTALRRLHVPKVLSGAVLLLAFVAAFGWAAWELREPAARWIEEAPGALGRLERKLGAFRGPMEKVSRAAEKMEEIASGGGEATPSVQVEEPRLGGAVAGVGHFAASVLVTLVLAYLLLVYDDALLAGVVSSLSRLRDKRRTVEIASELGQQMSRYLLTVAMINLAEGAAVGTAMQLLGMPNPWLWGAMAAVVNFVPYLGAFVGITVVGAVALLSLEPMAYALLAPASYAAINFVEGMVLSPIVIGKRLELNPVIVFVSVFFWGWIWGIGGALIAVPLLAMVKIVCDRVPSLAPVGALLAGARAVATE